MRTLLLQLAPSRFNAPVNRVLLSLLTVALLAPTAWAQNTFTQGNALSARTYNTDTGPTNSQLNLDFKVTHAGVLQNILTWGQNDVSGGPSGIGESFRLFVLRPLNSTNYDVVFSTGYQTVTALGTNVFDVSGTPFTLQTNDVIAHYGRGIPLSNNTGGPSSSYVAVTLPAPVVGTTITVPSATYPLYDDGGRDYAIQVGVSAPPFLVTTNSDFGPGSLRQAVLNANAFGGSNTITFATNLAGQTITLISGEIALNANITIDSSTLPGGLTISGGNVSRIFTVASGRTVFLNDLALSGGKDSSNAGAIENDGGTVTLNNCTVSGNSSFKLAGAIGNYQGTLTLSNCTLSSNSARREGGAIYNSFGSISLNNCTFVSNSSASASGGAIDNSSGSTVLNNCTFVSNSARNGGAIQNTGTLIMTACALAGNTVGTGSGPDLLQAGGILSATNCLIGDGTGSQLVNNLNGNLVGTSAAPINARLAPLGNYGGPTMTMPPLPGSPALDRGLNSITNTLPTDQRGQPRLFGSAVDIGAVEATFTVVVNTNNGGAGSLKAAIDSGGDNIIFTNTLSGKTIRTGLLEIRRSLAIDASALNGGVILDGRNLNPVLQIDAGTFVTLNSLTISNGYNSISGGGIYLTYGTLLAENCSFLNNHADAFGGGVENSSGFLTLNNCTFAGNSAGQRSGAVDDQNGTTRLNHCTVTGNSAPFYAGVGFDAGTSVVTLNNTIVAGNFNDDLPNASVPFTGTNNLFGVNPLLAPLGNYGGPTPTMPPLPGSPAINGCTNLTSSPSLATDQRSYPRLSGTFEDIGAVEGIYNAAGPGKIADLTRLTDGTARLTFTNLTDASFAVVATTNLSLSMSNWTRVGYATEISNGARVIQFIDADAANFPQRFYRIVGP